MPTFDVNGERYEIDVPDTHPMLWVLRERLGLTGTKFGCGIGQCGACTVLLDGRPVRSCQLPVSAVGEAAITTIEGLAGASPVQQAWVEEQVPQCGYCQSGQIMSATAMLSEVPEPSDEDIDRFMSGNICRCGTYAAIRRAIHRAARISAERTATDADGAPADTDGEASGGAHP